MIFTDKRLKLLSYVIQAHGDQKRKYTLDPYWFHLIRVAEMADDMEIPFGFEVGLCHDILEDTPLNDLGQLKSDIIHCGYSPLDAAYISLGVYALTDQYTKENYPDLNRKERKEKEAIRLSKIAPFYQSVKYCDLIDNSESITKYDPKFAEVYLKEKEQLLEKMNGGHHFLYKRCLAILNKHKIDSNESSNESKN